MVRHGAAGTVGAAVGARPHLAPAPVPSAPWLPVHDGGRPMTGGAVGCDDDGVLAPGFTADLAVVPLEELRTRRRLARQAEADLSYLRRMLQGRLDMIRAERDRRVGEPRPDDMVSRLRHVLSDTPPPTRPSARHLGVAPARPAATRCDAERLLADARLSDVRTQSLEELDRAQALFAEQERLVSRRRRSVQQVVDTLNAEVARRYRDGEARIEDLLAEAGAPDGPEGEPDR